MRSRRRVLARQREEPAAAADLRHRVADPGRAEGVPEAGSRRPRAATTASSAPSSTCSRFPDEIGSGLAVFHPKGGVIKREMEDYVRAPAHRGGLPVRRHAAHHQGGAVPHLRAPAVLRGHHVPADGHGGQRLLPQGHELPDAQPDLPVARAVVPRAAVAAVRVRLGVPVREVGRGARPDPGARADPGRLALVRHPGAGARRDQAPAGLRARRCCATSAWTTTTWSCPPGTTRSRDKFVGTDERVGGRPPRCSRTWPPRPGSTWCRTRAARRSTARRSRVQATRRDRPHLADVDHPVRLQPAGAASAWSTRRRTAPGRNRS